MPNKRVLVAGVALSDKPNHAVAIMDGLAKSVNWQIDQKWHVIGERILPRTKHIISSSQNKEEKFMILNRITKEVDLPSYEYLFVFDDDVEIPHNFIDRYLHIVRRRRYSLSQPARTHTSYIDHYFVSQLLGIESRRTNFVEIGPVTCIHSSAYYHLLPFDLNAPMGWGLDFCWPIILNQHNLKMGIVDQVPIEHSLRKPVTYYNYDETEARMRNFLAETPHISRQAAFSAIETYCLVESDKHNMAQAEHS
jgi:hypothetical protein